MLPKKAGLTRANLQPGFFVHGSRLYQWLIVSGSAAVINNGKSSFGMSSSVLVLLAVNGIICMINFWGNQAVLRIVHDLYLGSTTPCMLFLHDVLGLKISLTI